jgi:hypothetical protein
MNNMPNLPQHIILEFLDYKLRNRKYIKQIQKERLDKMERLIFRYKNYVDYYYSEEVEIYNEITDEYRIEQYRYIYFWISNKKYHNSSINKYIVFKQSVYDTNDFSVLNEYFDVDFDETEWPYKPDVPW